MAAGGAGQAAIGDRGVERRWEEEEAVGGAKGQVLQGFIMGILILAIPMNRQPG